MLTDDGNHGVADHPMETSRIEGKVQYLIRLREMINPTMRKGQKNTANQQPKKKNSRQFPLYNRIFKILEWLIILYGIMSVPYWLVMASNRYVSESHVLLEKTDQINRLDGDISSIVKGNGGPNRGDQLLLREYLLSVDMLKKLDVAFDLRAHYSNSKWDYISRMWSENPPMERFYSYWLSRVDVEYDDFSGVIDIRVQAYSPEIAHEIVKMMIKEGEEHMNLIAHELAQVQVQFLVSQVKRAHDRLLKASHALIEFQNKKGFVSPKGTVESLNAIIGKLEAQKTDLQTQLDALPSTLSPNHPTILRLKKSLHSIESQIAQNRTELASPARKTLNYTVEEFQRLQMEVGFVQDVYKTALSGLEKGREDAARTLDKISVFQSPTMPDFPTKPKRIYNALISLLLSGVLVSVLKMMESIIRDHVD